jgi:hypothetical protein
MIAALEACRDFYARFSTPSTLDVRTCAEAIRGAGDTVSDPDPWGDAMALAETLEDGMWELAAEAPEDGWEWTDETRSDLGQATALMLQALEVLKRVHERELPRFREWDIRTTEQQSAARSNVVTIR